MDPIVLDSYGISGKAKDPAGFAEEAKDPAGFAEEAKESRPMESEHPVMEINITLILLRNFDNELTR
ncbi:hypothetical protein RAH41_14675 [Gottfriedia acidiceleris]|uniref:hypothetical protein n=1 Tax=Gottfriedia acidiceleris TaxID=371036 RepID=UPI002F25FE98